MGKKKNNSTTYKKKNASKQMTSTDKRLITSSKSATKDVRNPFDNYTQKRHMGVMGQKNQAIKLSKAHSRDLQVRRDTLLVELRDKERSSNFTNGDTIESAKRPAVNFDEEQKKMYERSLQKLQKRDLKRKRFELGDENSVEESDVKKKKISATASTVGATLGDIDEKFDANVTSLLGDDYHDDDDVEFRNEFADKAARRAAKKQEGSFSTGKVEEDRYKEIILKSKQHKMERMHARELQMSLTDELDEEFKTLLPHLSKRKREGEEDIEKSEDNMDDYDLALRNFSYQPRVAPATLSKTETETALQKKQRLEKLEQERLERMNAGKAKSDKKVGFKESGDDLGYSEYLSDNEEDIDSDDDIDPTVQLGAAESDDKEKQAEEKEEDEEIEEEEVQQPVVEVNAIPFVIPAPTTHQELKDLLEGRNAAEISLIYNRLRALYAPSLGIDAKTKSQTLFTLSIKHFNSYISNIEREAKKSGDAILSFKLLDVLSDNIFGLADSFPKHATSEFKDHLVSMHTELMTRLATAKENRKVHGYPNSVDLLFLKLISNVFPVTDFEHAITTPANIYIHQCISDCEINSLRDVSAALFLCSMAIHFNYESHRYSPEVIALLVNVLNTVTASADEEQDREGNAKKNWLRLSKSDFKSESANGLNFNKFILNTPTDKLSIVRCAVSIVKRYSELFDHSLPSYAEIFAGVRSVIKAIQDVTPSSHALHKEIQHVIQRIDQTSATCIEKRKKLLYLDVKPQAIPQFTPLVYGDLKGDIVDAEKARKQTKVLAQKVKRAKRQAVREIRKDNVFLARAREESQATEQKQRKDKYKEIMNDLEKEKREQYQLDFGNRNLAREMKQARTNRRPHNRSSGSKKPSGGKK